MSGGVGCADVRDLLYPFLDGELDVDKNVELLKHLELCSTCQERCETERALAETVTRAATEPLDEVTRARLLSAGMAPRRAIWPWATVAAALLLVAAGLGGFVVMDPYCVWGCPTQNQLERVYAQVNAVQASAPVESGLTPPRCSGSGMNPDGTCRMVEPADKCADLPFWDYTSACGKKKAGYVRLPGACAHGEKVHADGRKFFEGKLKCGAPFVGWRDGEGVSACVGVHDTTPDDLYVMATAIRNGQ